ncbi:hypothetical protein [Ruegeria faecimaris]|uniref:hypothetical protein n=1 Tax=Ruegeria faecimaris TaxID=686389 RepID=UPI00232B9063|nr:hypothetical protein [Ruegeria faecimaris]
MAFQVYALVHTRSGRFLMFRRPILTFFQRGNGGQIFPEGQKLHGGGRYALPYAQVDPEIAIELWEDDNFIAEAGQQILIDCCGALIEFLPPEAADKGPVSIEGEHEILLAPATEVVTRFDEDGTRSAVYFAEVSDADLDRIRDYMVEVLAEARAAMLAVIQDNLYEYTEIEAFFPHAPFDNIHTGVDVWQLDIERLEISGLKSSKLTKGSLQAISELEVVLAVEDA